MIEIRRFRSLSGEKLSLTRYGYALFGTLIGTAMGGGLGAVLFSLTGEGIFLAIAGLGGGIGLSLGTALQQLKRTS